jgi:dihydrofolate reductase
MTGLVTYAMGVSADGYIVDPDGSLDWSTPEPEVFRFWIEQTRPLGAHLLGRRLYETMLYWETAGQDPALSADEREWTTLWTALPKVVFSSTLTTVQGNARLATSGLAEEVAALRGQTSGDIAIGGAKLAAAAAAQDLIDEYHAMVHPVLLGGGVPFFPQQARRVDLRLVETRRFGADVVWLRYRVQR